MSTESRGRKCKQPIGPEEKKTWQRGERERERERERLIDSEESSAKKSAYSVP